MRAVNSPRVKRLQIGQQRLQHIAEAIRTAQFFTLPQELSSPLGEHSASVVLHITMNGRTRQVAFAWPNERFDRPGLLRFWTVWSAVIRAIPSPNHNDELDYWTHAVGLRLPNKSNHAIERSRKRMRRFLLFPIFVAIYGVRGAAGGDTLPEAVLASHSLGELSQRLGRAPESPEFEKQTPLELLSLIANAPSDEKSWQAAYHYRSMANAAFSLMFKWACFDTLLEHPTLFRDRFVSGDDRALELMRCAMWSDGSTQWGNLFGAVTKHGFKDVASYYKRLFEVLESSGGPPQNATGLTRRKEFLERANKDLAEAEREMNSHE
jgi:hypothetical protein